MCKKTRRHIVKCLFVLFVSVSLNTYGQTIGAPVLVFDNADASTRCVKEGLNEYVSFTCFYTGTTFNVNNFFSVELSDANGDFNADTQNLGIIVDDVNVGFNTSFFIFGDNAQFKLPENASGDNYRVRLVSSDPVRESEPSEPFAAYFEPNIPLTINGFDDAIICDGNSVEVSIDGTGAFDMDDFLYAWYKNGTIIEGERDSSIFISEPGDYSASFYLGNELCTANANKSNVITAISLDVDAVEILGEDNVQICSDETYTMVANVSDTNFIYSWYKDGDLEQMSDVNSYTTPANNPYGTYELVVQIGDCPSESQFVVVEPRTDAGYVVEITSDNPGINLLATGTNFSVATVPSMSGLTYDWYNVENDEFLIQTSQSSIELKEEGEYYVVVTDSSSSCPVAVQSEVFTVLNGVSLIPSIGVDEFYDECNVESANLSLLELLVAATDGNTYELTDEQLGDIKPQWYYNNSIITGEISESYQVNSFDFNGDYKYNVTIGTGSQISNDSNVLSIYLIPETEISSLSNSNSICPGSTIDLSVNITPGYTYKWFKGNDELQVNDPSSIEVSEVGDYYVTYSGNGCLDVKTNTIQVTQFEDDSLVVSPSSIAVLLDEKITLSVSGANSYDWYFESVDEDNSLSSLDVYEADKLGTYIVVGQVENCTVTATIQVVPDDGSIKVPNIISPFNGDGANDTWKIPNRLAFQQNVNVIVYNSRGQEVLNAFEYQNNWPENVSNIKGGMVFYYKIIQENTLIKAGTISVLD